ncbi:MAG: hypothetical protein WEF50_12445 [Myxococcota bacterium]
MERSRSPAARALAGAHWLALAAIYARLAARAFLHFPLDWDFLAYHLPGALASYGLTSYTPEPRLVAVIAGFPPLPRLLAGALVLATERFSAAGAINVVAFCALLAGLGFLYGRWFGLRWFLTALLGVPLFVFHLASGYVDLFAACWLTLALAALSGLAREAPRPLASAVLFVVALGLAMLSKFQAWPVAALIGAAGLWRFAALARAGRLARARALALGASLVVALGFWPVRNTIVYANPVYPVQFPLAPGLFPNALVEADSGVFNLPPWLEPHARPLRFAASAAEWNRFHSGERFVWSLDQGARANPAGSPHHRLGGWFPWTIAWLVLGAGLALRAGRIPGSALTAFAFALALVACLPQSHELRYWLFVPLTLALWSARGLAGARSRTSRVLKAALLAAAAFVLLVARPFAIDARPPQAFAPKQARAFWALQAAQPSTGPVRVCDVNPEGIFYAGPSFREYRVIGCFGDPESRDTKE